jgi:hypothetical protein
MSKTKRELEQELVGLKGVVEELLRETHSKCEKLVFANKTIQLLNDGARGMNTQAETVNLLVKKVEEKKGCGGGCGGHK